MLGLTPTERLQKLADVQAFVQELQAARKAKGTGLKAGSGMPRPTNDFERILKILSDAEVRFVVVGDLAVAAYGRAPATCLLEVCYDRSRDNVERLAEALKPFHPRLRGVPDDLPFCLDAAAVARGMNFTLTTDFGDIDLFGEVIWISGYKEVRALSSALVLFGFQCAVLSLEGLVRCKRATARPKDLLILPEIEALLEMESQVKSESGRAEVPSKGRPQDKKP